MNFENLKNLTASIQSIVTVVAILAAGVWALYTFQKLGATTKARAEIQALQRSAVEQPNLSIVIDATIAGDPPAPRIAMIKVSLRNDGKKAVEYREPQIVLYKVQPAQPANAEPRKQSVAAHGTFLDDDGQLQFMPPRILRVGQSRTLAFPMEVDEPGLYCIQFSAIYSGMDLEGGTFTHSDDVNITAYEQSLLWFPK